MKELRDELSLTQNELAARAGVSRDVVIRLEHGKRLPYAYNMRKIADALGVEVGFLMRGPDRGSGSESRRGDGDAEAAMALARLWAAREGISEEEALRRIRLEQDQLGRHKFGTRALGRPAEKRIIPKSGRDDVGSAAVSAVRG